MFNFLLIGWRTMLSFRYYKNLWFIDRKRLPISGVSNWNEWQKRRIKKKTTKNRMEFIFLWVWMKVSCCQKKFSRYLRCAHIGISNVKRLFLPFEFFIQKSDKINSFRKAFFKSIFLLCFFSCCDLILQFVEIYFVLYAKNNFFYLLNTLLSNKTNFSLLTEG